MDSGIDHDHPHFRKHSNIDPTSPLHKDFTVDGGGPFDDENGHGTHVAGIIAGEWRVPPDDARRAIAADRGFALSEERTPRTSSIRRRGSTASAAWRRNASSLACASSTKTARASVSNLIAAIAHVQEINGYGRRLLIHGVNMSVGYNFEPEWFACGQSPLCVEVDRLVKTRRRRGRRGRQHRLRHAQVAHRRDQRGHGANDQRSGQCRPRDHRRIDASRHAARLRRVVLFLERADRRRPAEARPRRAGRKDHLVRDRHVEDRKGRRTSACDYVETSGTSMAAPHVSGVIAAFLSVRGEFIGKAERVKEIFLVDRDRSATRPLFPGRRSGRSDARHPVRLSFPRSASTGEHS